MLYIYINDTQSCCSLRAGVCCELYVRNAATILTLRALKFEFWCMCVGEGVRCHG